MAFQSTHNQQMKMEVNEMLPIVDRSSTDTISRSLKEEVLATFTLWTHEIHWDVIFDFHVCDICKQTKL